MNMKKLPVDVLIAKRRILILCAAMVAFAAMTACGEKETEYNTTHPIVGEWEYQSATCEVVHWGSGAIDTTYDLGSYAPWRDMVFNADNTAIIELRNDTNVVPPQYDTITFRWSPGFEESWISYIELSYDTVFYNWIHIEENNNGVLRFIIPGPGDYDAHNQEWYHFTYRRR